MPPSIGIDSRLFVRDPVKSDGSKGHFESVLGVTVKVKDMISFDQHYKDEMKNAFLSVGLEPEYSYYCTHDINSVKQKGQIVDKFVAGISKHVEKVHVFYTLFSKDRLSEVQVYGRLAQKNKLQLSEPTRSYEELISSHLLQCFPAICAWRLSNYFATGSIQFHTDFYQGHIFEAQEELEYNKFNISTYPNGDCANPLISTADLLIDLLDRRLYQKHAFLLFENIRPMLSEFGDKVLAYTISNKHLPKITPLDKVSIDTMKTIKHPVFWFFKGDDLINAETVKTSPVFRSLVDWAAAKGGVVKMFGKNNDIHYVQNGDYGIYHNTHGKEIIDSYIKLGKEIKPLPMDFMVPKAKNSI